VSDGERNDDEAVVTKRKAILTDEEDDDDEGVSFEPKVAVKRKPGAPNEEAEQTASNSFSQFVEEDENEDVTSSKPTAAGKGKPAVAHQEAEMGSGTVSAKEEEEEEERHEPAVDSGIGFACHSGEEDQDPCNDATDREILSDDIRDLLASTDEEDEKESPRDAAAKRADDLEKPKSGPSDRSNVEVDDIFVKDDEDEPINAKPDSAHEDLTKAQPTSEKKQEPANAENDSKPKVESGPIHVDVAAVEDFEDEVRGPSDEADIRVSMPSKDEDDRPSPRERGFELPSTQAEVETFLEEKCAASKD
jgi:hypothetical protein